jgi:prevent-host-death family protein
MRKINIHEAKTHLSRILESVSKGESVLIAKAGKPMAVLSPYKTTGKRREPGALRGKIHLTAGFDEADELIASLFNNGTRKD